MRVLLLALLAVGLALAEPHWPSFRGPNASGVAEGAASATAWDFESGEGVLWRAAVPGLGHSSPIVWGDRLYIATAVSERDKAGLRVGLYGDIAPVEDESEHEWRVLCFDKKTGKLIWERTAHKGVPAVKRHTKATHANTTLATDGKHIVAFFASEGLYCYDVEGKLLWKRDFGVLDAGFFRVPEAQWEFASSPVIHDGRVVVLADVQEGSFLASIEIEDGADVWRVERADVPTWGTPTIVDKGGEKQIVVNGWKHLGGYDFATGEEIWKIDGGGDIPIPTPVYGDGLIYFTNAHGSLAPVYAVDPSAKGDISLKTGETSNDGIVWSVSRGGAYMATPIYHNGLLYVLRNNGVLSVYDAKSGERAYQQRIGDGRTGFTASPMLVDDKIYIPSELGEVYVIAPGREYKELAKNSVGELVLASPAASDGMLYFRTDTELVAIAAPRE